MRIISKKYLTEAEVCQWFNITTDQLDRLRLERDFPYSPVIKSVRMYLLEDVEAWMHQKRKNIPIAE